MDNQLSIETSACVQITSPTCIEIVYTGRGPIYTIVKGMRIT
jgi:hypothetical protein